MTKDWKDIHKDFRISPDFQSHWKSDGFTYEETKSWIEVGFTPWDSSMAKEWKNNFSCEQTKSWIEAGLNPQEINLANHLKQNNIQSNQLTADKLFELRKEFYPSYPNAQAYLDQHCPSEIRKDVIHLDFRNLNLEGDLDLWGFDEELKVYLAGNPNLGEIKNEPSDAEIIYYSCKDSQEYLDKKYPNKEQVEEIEFDENLEFYQPVSELIIDNYPNLKTINEDCWGWGCEEIFNAKKIVISNCPQLETINTEYFENLEELTLYNLPNLKKLDCSNNKLTTLDLATCLGLQRITLSNSQLAEIKLPVNREKLRYLGLSNNKLKELDISNNLNLKMLELSNNNFLQDLVFLSHLKNLETLDLSNNKFYGSLEPLSNLTELRELYVRTTSLSGSLEALKNMSKLKKLDISNTDIDSGLEYLPESLEDFYCSTKEKKDAKVKAIEQWLSPYNNRIQVWKQAQQNQFLFAEQENKISYLELRVTELINLIKTQKQKIINAFLRLFPERDLLQELIIIHLEYTRFKEKGIDSIGYDDNLEEYEDKCREIKKQLRNKLSKETMNGIQAILTDCEKLVRDELELETKLSDKTFLIENQKQTLLQITNSEKITEQKTKLTQQEKIHQDQLNQWKELIKELKEKIYQNSKLLTEAKNQNQQLQIERGNLISSYPMLEEQLTKNKVVLERKTKEVEELQEKVRKLEEQINDGQVFEQAAQIVYNPK